jgi:hypothetical protein
MKKYEYRQFTVETTGILTAKLAETYVNQLNDLGKDGWEFVQALPLARPYGKTGSVTFLMKREVNI